MTIINVGVAERICIGCTHIGDSSAEEKLLFSSTSENTEDVAEAIRASLSTDNDVQLSDIVCSPCVEFTKVNPNNTSFRTIKIHNFWYGVQYLCSSYNSVIFF